MLWWNKKCLMWLLEPQDIKRNKPLGKESASSISPCKFERVTSVTKGVKRARTAGKIRCVIGNELRWRNDDDDDEQERKRSKDELRHSVITTNTPQRPCHVFSPSIFSHLKDPSSTESRPQLTHEHPQTHYSDGRNREKHLCLFSDLPVNSKNEKVKGREAEARGKDLQVSWGRRKTELFSREQMQ